MATTGGRDVSQIKVPLPMNTYVAEYVPHDMLLPKVGTRSQGALRAAVREVLDDDRYRRRARDLEAAFARRDGVAEIAALVDEVTSEQKAAVER